MTPDKILEYCLKELDGTVLVRSWGESGIFYNPQNRLKRGVYILTVKEKDGNHDKSSKLDRENIYRVNVGVRKNTFAKMFGVIPQRPPKAVSLKWGMIFLKRIRFFHTQFMPGWDGSARSIRRKKLLKN